MLLERHRPLNTRCLMLCRTTMALAVIALVAGLTLTLGAAPAKGQAAPPGAPDGNEIAGKLPGDGEDALADVAELHRREAALWQELEKQLIVVNGAPINLKEIKAKFEEQRAKLRAQMKAEAAQNTPGKSPRGAARVDDPALTIEERLRARRAQEAANERPDVLLESLIAQQKKLVATRDDTQQAIQSAKTQLGADHPRVKAMQEQLDYLEQLIKACAQERREIEALVDPAPRRPITPPMDQRAAGVQLDLVSLANTIVDAWGAAKLAEVRYAALSKQREAVAAGEIEAAKVNLETAKRRLQLLRDIAAISLQSAEADLNTAQQRREKGLASDQNVTEAISKVKMLQMILNGAN